MTIKKCLETERRKFMTEQKSKGQLLAEEFDRMLEAEGLAPIPTVVPDRPRVWITIHPVKPPTSDED